MLNFSSTFIHNDVGHITFNILLLAVSKDILFLCKNRINTMQWKNTLNYVIYKEKASYCEAETNHLSRKNPFFGTEHSVNLNTVFDVPLRIVYSVRAYNYILTILQLIIIK